MLTPCWDCSNRQIFSVATLGNHNLRCAQFRLKSYLWSVKFQIMPLALVFCSHKCTKKIKMLSFIIRMIGLQNSPRVPREGGGHIYGPPRPYGLWGCLPSPMGSRAVLQSYHSNDTNFLSCVFCIFCVQGSLAPVHLYILCIFLQNHNLSSYFDYYLFLHHGEKL